MKNTDWVSACSFESGGDNNLGPHEDEQGTHFLIILRVSADTPIAKDRLINKKTANLFISSFT